MAACAPTSTFRSGRDRRELGGDLNDLSPTSPPPRRCTRWMGKRKGRRQAVTAGSGGGGGEPLLGNDGVDQVDDVCFSCMDGGELLICNYSNCTKAYHRECLEEDDHISDGELFCRWHTCFNCKRRSCFQCLCCPDVSVCRRCLTEAQFVKVGGETKGFCINCLRTVVMIETDSDVSDGVKVDFEDPMNYEYFFKRYWKALNRKQGLTLHELQKAFHYLNTSANCGLVSDPEHIQEEEHMSDDDFSVNALLKQGKSREKKKTRTMNTESSSSKGTSERNRGPFAALNLHNINLIYLKKSVVIDLLKQPESFENKVVDCIVKVKFYKPAIRYHLRRVTGIGKSSEEYQIGDTYTDVLLCIFGNSTGVKLSSLSNEDAVEVECEEFRQLVQKEHFERHTVAELEDKARSVHRDIVSHWIDATLRRLPHLINQADENGRHKEKWDYLDQQKLLKTEHGRKRLLDEAPQVILDVEDSKDK